MLLIISIATLSIIMSMIALTISLILAVRLFLLDKDYCEFSIIDKGSNNTGLDHNTYDRKHGHILTLLSPKIKVLKSDIYDLEITGIDASNILPLKDNKICHLKLDTEITISYKNNIKQIITITYRDLKNNKYEQKLFITPFYNTGNINTSQCWSILLTNRKWSFINSFKRKYL